VSIRFVDVVCCTGCISDTRSSSDTARLLPHLLCTNYRLRNDDSARTINTQGEALARTLLGLRTKPDEGSGSGTDDALHGLDLSSMHALMGIDSLALQNAGTAGSSSSSSGGSAPINAAAATGQVYI
jgi:hypothetical protein